MLLLQLPGLQLLLQLCSFSIYLQQRGQTHIEVFNDLNEFIFAFIAIPIRHFGYR